MVACRPILFNSFNLEFNHRLRICDELLNEDNIDILEFSPRILDSDPAHNLKPIHTKHVVGHRPTRS